MDQVKHLTWVFWQVANWLSYYHLFKILPFYAIVVFPLERFQMKVQEGRIKVA